MTLKRELDRLAHLDIAVESLRLALAHVKESGRPSRALQQEIGSVTKHAKALRLKLGDEVKKF